MIEDDGLYMSKVPRALEVKSKLFGFEIPDLFLIFMNLTFTNLVFGATSFRYSLVWGSTVCLALFLYFIKRGRPDNYLQHLGEFLTRPAYFKACGSDRLYRRYRKD